MNMQQSTELEAEFGLLLERTARNSEKDAQVKSLKNSVEALTFKYQDLNSVLKVAYQSWYNQVCLTVSTETNHSAALAMSIRTVIRQLSVHAASSHSTIEELAYHLCPIMLLDLSRETAANGLFTDEAYFAAEVIITAMGHILGDKYSSELSKCVVKVCKNSDVSLDVLWLVMSHSWMDMEQYLLINSSLEGSVEKFAKSLTNATGLPSNNTQRTTQILSDLLSFLVVIRFSEQDCNQEGDHKSLNTVAEVILDTVIKNLLDMSVAADAGFRINIYELVSDSYFIELEMLQKFFAQQIMLILTHRPIHTVTKVVGEHSKWSYPKTPSFIYKIFKQLLKPFAAGEVKELLQRVVERSEINWEYLLMFVSHVVVLYVDGPQMLQGLIQVFMEQAFHSFELERLILAFLLARHAGLEKAHLFPSYADWFQTMFGVLSSSHANSKKGFTFLLKCLTDLVPFEPAMCLKVHVLYPPAVPSKCRLLLNDYILLAKLRLQDLKESIEDTALYGSPNNSETNEVKQKLLLQAQSDVEKALQSYESVGKIPGTIIEASIFRKPYYIGHFLPALLTPRPVPDPPDLKMKFILDLKRAGKIPSSLYQDYETSCAVETVHHLKDL